MSNKLNIVEQRGKLDLSLKCVDSVDSGDSVDSMDSGDSMDSVDSGCHKLSENICVCVV